MVNLHSFFPPPLQLKEDVGCETRETQSQLKALGRPMPCHAMLTRDKTDLNWDVDVRQKRAEEEELRC